MTESDSTTGNETIHGELIVLNQKLDMSGSPDMVDHTA